MKKYTAPRQEKEDDKIRLMALTSDPYRQVWSYDGKAHPEFVCGYNLGFYIELLRDGSIMIEEYAKGEFIGVCDI